MAYVYRFSDAEKALWAMLRDCAKKLSSTVDKDNGGHTITARMTDDRVVTFYFSDGKLVWIR